MRGLLVGGTKHILTWEDTADRNRVFPVVTDSSPAHFSAQSALNRGLAGGTRRGRDRNALRGFVAPRPALLAASGSACERFRWRGDVGLTLREYRSLEVGELNFTHDLYERIVEVCGWPR